MDFDKLVDDINAIVGYAKQATSIELRDRYGSLFWDYCLDRYFCLRDKRSNVENEDLKLSFMIDDALTKDILESFKHGCDLRKRYYIIFSKCDTPTLLQVLEELLSCNRNTDDVCTWLLTTPVVDYAYIKLLRGVMKFDHQFALDILLNAPIFTDNVECVIIAASIATLFPEHSVVLKNKLCKAMVYSDTQKLIQAMWADTPEGDELREKHCRKYLA